MKANLDDSHQLEVITGVMRNSKDESDPQIGLRLEVYTMTEEQARALATYLNEQIMLWAYGRLLTPEESTDLKKPMH